MREIYVVRHAQVTVDHSIPSSQWALSEEGVHSARALARKASWRGVTRIYHSPEPKAAATANIISEITGIEADCEDDLRELSIPWIASQDEFVRRVGEYLSGANDPEFGDWDTKAVLRGFFSGIG